MSKFYEASKNERLFLKKILEDMTKDNTYHYSYYMTDPEGLDIYDGFISLFDKVSGSVYKRYIIEIKIRDIDYDELLLEKKKLDSLTKKSLESDSEMLYICVIPSGTYIFNLSKLGEVEFTKVPCNKTTVINSGKIMKTVTFLPKKIASKVIKDLKFYDLKHLIREEEDNKKMKEEIRIHKQNRCLFEYLLKKENN